MARMYRFMLFTIGALATCALLEAQSTATLTGTVADPSGAVIPGAQVVSRNIGTGLELRTAANANGLFRIPDVPVGTYEVKVSQEGFETLVQSGIEMLTAHTVNLSLVLRVGSSAQSVSVEAVIPLVQSTTSDVQTTAAAEDPVFAAPGGVGNGAERGVGIIGRENERVSRSIGAAVAVASEGADHSSSIM